MRGGGRAVKCPVALFCLTLLLMSASPAAGRGGDDARSLNLQFQGGVFLPSVEIDPAIADPHEEECDTCHAWEGEAADGGVLKTGDDSIGLCLECHPGSNLHPVNIPVPKEVDVAAFGIPPGKGDQEGKITCLTCHYIHGDTHERSLLRTGSDSGGRRMDTLCNLCHSNRLKEKSPHSAAGDTCRLCHMNPPREGEGLESLGPDVQATCNFCHDVLKNRHFLSVNPFSDEYILSEMMEVDIPLLNGEFTCVSCHDPHAVESRKKLLREDYLFLAGISKKINPHWKDVMCIACHEGEPERGSALLKEGGDLIRLCYRCHAFKYSRNDIHPVNMMPSRFVTIPPEMPLKDGRVTCETCHDSSLQEGGDRVRSLGRSNPKFLRGGFTTRKEFCFRCHGQEDIRYLNAHDQLDAEGRMRSATCVFCHSTVPDQERGGYLLQFDEETVNDLCLLCHPDAYEGDHPMAPHFVTPSRAVMKAMSTSEDRLGVTFPLFDEKVVCITCHNPHQEGVIEDRAAAEGAGAGKRLRVAEGRSMCRGCHLSK